MPTDNATHRKRLARAYAEQTGITYMAALDVVTKAAVAGLLPSTLDDAGMKAALRVLTAGQPATITIPGAVLPHHADASVHDAISEQSTYLVRSSLRLLRQVWQGRVAWERHGVRKPGFRFTIDNAPVSDVHDIELRWLRDHDYITTPPLTEDEEWSVAKTTDFGDEVLRANGADVDKFRDGLPDTARRTSPPGTIDIDDAWDKIRAVERGDAPSGSVVVEVTGQNSLSSPGHTPQPSENSPPKPGSNEEARQALERSARYSNRIGGWFKTQKNADPRPVRWQWADHEAGYPKDSLSDIDVEFSDGHHEFMAPSDLPFGDALDKDAARLMGGPYTSQVSLSDTDRRTDRRTEARCDVCNRTLEKNEPWWMVADATRRWDNNAGVVCGLHHPDRLSHAEQPHPSTTKDTTMSTDANTDLDKREQALLSLLEQADGRTQIAGIPECLTALALVKKGLVRVESGTITPDGGSGTITLTTRTVHTKHEALAAEATGHWVAEAFSDEDTDIVLHAKAPRPDAGTKVHKARPDTDGTHCAVCMQRINRVPGGQGPTWVHTDTGAVAAAGPDPEHVEAEDEKRMLSSVSFAHEGNPFPRCTATSWRSHPNRRDGEYGPGGFNRCVKRARHESERHIDEWGNVFELDPKFRVIKNVTAGEVARVAAKDGMILIDGSGKQIDPDLLDDIFPYKATTPDDLAEEVRARLAQNQLVQTKSNEILKISEIEKESVTAQVVYPIPARTSVRRCSYVEAATWREPSDVMVAKYERAWGFAT